MERQKQERWKIYAKVAGRYGNDLGTKRKKEVEGRVVSIELVRKSG